MSDSEIKVAFNPSGQRGTFPRGTILLDAAKSLGVDIDSVCGGRGICCKCQVKCVEGTFLKHQITSFQSSLSGLSEIERLDKTLERLREPENRLSCQATILSDCVIDVPMQSQIHSQIIRKEVDRREIKTDRVIRLHYIELDEPNIDIPKGDINYLLEALDAQWELSGLSYNFSIVPNLQKILKKGDRKVTVAVFEGNEILSVWPGYHDSIFGVSLDIGSTTVAACLSDLSSGDVIASVNTMNPQIRFGEDLMSRVSFAMMNSNGAYQMTESIRGAINDLLHELTEESNVPLTSILEISIVANPVMHHILLGIDPCELGGAPFSLAIDTSVSEAAVNFGLNINPGGKVYVLPCIAGHVGADTAGVILSEKPFSNQELTLLVDVGTNAEVVLGNSKRLLACSSPTGPAFEGAQISCGQRATNGAIERVRIDSESLEARIKVIGSENWSDNEEFFSDIKSFGVNGICGSGIIEVIAEMYLAGIISSEGVIDGSLTDKFPSIIKDGRTFSYVLYHGDVDSKKKKNIVITQNDIRQIQLAKAALYAGIKLLMDELKISHVDRIKLAGAFGTHISVKHAMILGLIPDCNLAKVSSIGNAAETGARIALLNKDQRRVIESKVKNIEKIETATAENFQKYFVDAMAFPNKVDEFPILFENVKRPLRKSITQPRRTRRRRV